MSREERTMNDWPTFEDTELETRRQEAAHYPRLDAAEDYAAYIERMAEEAGDEPVSEWVIVAAANTRRHDAPYDLVGTDLDPEPPTPAAPAVLPFDRAAHCRRIAADGGRATLAVHGRAIFRAIGTAGARVTIARHGVGYWRGLVTAKGWQEPQKPCLVRDLAAGRALAALDCAA
jgi:hypothetical protein